jgi:hypothetical protein
MADQPKFVLTPEDTWTECPKCKCKVPSFTYLDPELQKQVDNARDGSSKARLVITFDTAGIPLRVSKPFALHLHGIPEPCYGNESVECPHCGKPLRTARAKQCRWCGKDWHEQ